MATSQNTRDPRATGTMLSRRTFSGNVPPTFRSVSSAWSQDQDDKPYLAFEVSWPGTKSEDAFDGYCILVELGDGHTAEDLLLVRKPVLGDLALAVTESGSLIDAFSREPFAAAPHVLGRVVSERSHQTPEQRLKRERTYLRAKWAKHPGLLNDLDWQERFESSFGLAQAEAQRIEDECKKPGRQPSAAVLWTMERALKTTQAFSKVRDTFRQDDASAQESYNPKFGPGYQEDPDDALVQAFALVYRVGQYQGPESYMLDPEPEDWETVERLITECLERIIPEVEATGHPVEPSPLTSIDITTSLIDLPAYHRERDRFRRSDVEESRWPDKLTADMDNSRYDFALRSMLGRWFRAGMLAARTFRRPTPAIKVDAEPVLS